MDIANASEFIFRGISNPRKAKDYIWRYMREFRWHRAKSRDDILTDVSDFQMWLNPDDDGVSKFLYLDGLFAEDETSFYDRFVQDDMVIADVGANIGYFTLIFSRNITNGKIYSFEPEPQNYTLLRKNLQENKIGDVVTEQLALSDTNGETSLYKHPTNGGGHSLHEDGVLPFDDFPDDGNAETVRSTTFDDYFDSRPDPDLVKIDVEGGEPNVLRGMMGSLETKPVISLEYTPHMWSRNPEEIFSLLESYDYSFYKIESGGALTQKAKGDLTQFDDGWYDIVAVTDKEDVRDYD